MWRNWLIGDIYLFSIFFSDIFLEWRPCLIFGNIVAILAESHVFTVPRIDSSQIIPNESSDLTAHWHVTLRCAATPLFSPNSALFGCPILFVVSPACVVRGFSGIKFGQHVLAGRGLVRLIWSQMFAVNTPRAALSGQSDHSVRDSE